VKRGFWLPADRLIVSATSVLALSLVASSMRTALIDSNWICAMEEDIASLITNNTWDLISCLVGSNIVTRKWIFQHKFNSDDSLEWYKAHWVICGFTQRPGFDYDKTFNLMVKSAMVRMMLSLAISRSWPVHQLNVKNAFLHDTL
jgi:hypothetical protein